MLLTYKENVHSTQMYIPLKPLFSRHKGIGVQFTDEPTGNLDSHSTAEIIQILKGLHKAGKTVIVITHDPDIAAQSRRVVRLEDGQIVEDYINEDYTSDDDTGRNLAGKDLTGEAMTSKGEEADV